MYKKKKRINRDIYRNFHYAIVLFTIDYVFYKRRSAFVWAAGTRRRKTKQDQTTTWKLPFNSKLPSDWVQAELRNSGIRRRSIRSILFEIVNGLFLLIFVSKNSNLFEQEELLNFRPASSVTLISVSKIHAACVWCLWLALFQRNRSKDQVGVRPSSLPIVGDATKIGVLCNVRQAFASSIQVGESKCCFCWLVSRSHWGLHAWNWLRHPS